MTFDENTTKIILAVIGVVVVALGSSLITIRKIRKRNNTVRQENITITGTGKIVGGDDKSTN
ncbi:hypothetical protein GCM10011387_06170 [Pedobacter quisquiliarum]|jgi:hypothetical protein|uniref:Uncharacterized protein n=1 Tax=Pedobacter quisquiliarum TaxID=1834438 RepID=A0A916X8V1_9SPHI|nr:hypothetical protein [Pedobacter quisquiliarum]GGC55315.1 hypothetical protein GCM10011387_06170 [Pedobacter quisquiliarum]